MSIFNDAEKRKRLMKGGLPLILAVAWMPIVGMVVLVIIGAPLATLVGWPFTFVLVGAVTLSLLWLFLKLFRKSGHKIKQGNP
uniref:Uncharacterized protein n=1 Tax=Chlorobium chlorochromatii (strain CaD3) TaxID=340177 RepID=Q3ASW9_CHLCH